MIKTTPEPATIEQEELRGIARTVAELEWLLLILIAYVTTMFSADIHYGLNKARLLSESDDLTGIYNRRGFAILGGRLYSGRIAHHGRSGPLRRGRIHRSAAGDA